MLFVTRAISRNAPSSPARTFTDVDDLSGAGVGVGVDIILTFGQLALQSFLQRNHDTYQPSRPKFLGDQVPEANGRSEKAR